MENQEKILIENFFKENSIVMSNIESFNNFIDEELNNIIEENKEVVPTIIPPNMESLKLRLDKIWVTKPEITEADGSKRNIFPVEARLRKVTYAAPIFIEISSHVDGVQKETFTTQIGSLPIMLKSKNCLLHGLNREELIEKGEDPSDPGGYFIINGTEKVLVSIEDLVLNRLLIRKESVGPSEYSGTVFSEHGSYKIPHKIEKLKDGIFYITFTRVKRMPLIVIIKALGLLKDEYIIKHSSTKEQFDEVIGNLYSFVDIKTEEDALDFIAKRIGIAQSREIRLERTKDILDKFLLPHIGVKQNDRMSKAYNLCKMIKKYVLVEQGRVDVDDRDHHMNKKLKLAGDNLADLFRVNLKILIGDMLYNFQRIVKRGKFPSIRVIIREKLLSGRLYSAMATGNWVGGRKGVSQRMDRTNFLSCLSHLQRVSSPLSADQENFEARELHATHLGRLCPIETPEGTNIGLRKNLALLATISRECEEKEVKKMAEKLGLSPIKRPEQP